MITRNKVVSSRNDLLKHGGAAMPDTGDHTRPLLWLMLIGLCLALLARRARKETA